MTSSATIKQDLPPEGGYRKLDFKRVPAKQIWRWWSIIPAYIASTSIAYYLWRTTRAEIWARDLENQTATLAIMPIVIAEKDRALLKNLRRIRDEETELMKNVEGWETGTLFGEKIYKTQSDDEFRLPCLNEYYVQSKPEELSKMSMFYHYF
uniref:NADH dehydrogenase [ubiquinone] 1 alpha subcomplex subunit 13 n=1 Tax=Cacopsylla melanoneura TaxID=428564 RepID=A0A8D8WI04_9HEMI